MDKPTIIVLMGVSGSGKTTVGRSLAEKLDCAFLDADDFHPNENIAKMARGTPLTDFDRQPWLRGLHGLIEGARAEGVSAKDGSMVLACSLLKREYRNVVLGSDDRPCIKLVYLQCEYAVLETRLRKRTGHFFGPELLASQFEILEEPAADEALKVSADAPLEELVGSISRALGL